MDEKNIRHIETSSQSKSIAEGTADLEITAADNGLGGSSEDIAAQLFKEIQQYSPEELAAERDRIRRKLDLYLMPLVCVTYTLQFLDKLSLNYASAYDLVADLGLQGQRYSWVAAIYNFGYVFWAIPANLLIQRLPVAKYTGSMILLWGIVLIAHVGAKNYGGILILRFLLGMFEANISPAIMMFCSMFYTRAEQPLRMCIFLAFNGMATMVGALLGYGLGHAHDVALQTWQLIFLVIGVLNFAWACVFLYLVPDSPTSARFLSHRERVIAIDRIAGNMIGVKNPNLKRPQIFEALTDVKTWSLAIIGLGCGVVNGGVSNFASSLIKGYGFSGINATLLQLPTGAFEFVLVPLAGLGAGYWKDARCWALIVILLPPLGGLLGIRLTGLEHKWTLVGCTWLQYLIGGPVILSWNLLTTNIAGHTKRSISNGLWFLFYAAGNIAGANIFFAREAPRYYSALTGLITCYCGMLVVTLFLRQYMAWENRRKDRIFGKVEGIEAEAEAAESGFRDMTDKEQIV
ncbi:hypothetical protein RUND412_003726 [Rhizina undulata]